MIASFLKSRANIKLRLSTFTALMFCAALSSLAQKTSKDYFLPETKKNKAIFSIPDAYEKESAFTRVICYLKKGELYEIADTTRYHEKLMRSEKRIVEFTSTDVHLLKLLSNTEAEPNKVTLYDPPKTILKVPGIGQTLTWSYEEAHGQKTNFIAEWVKFKLNNVNTRAIRVTETLTLSNGLVFAGRRIYYYKEGIGLWKMEGETKELQQTICEFVTLEYDSTMHYK